MKKLFEERKKFINKCLVLDSEKCACCRKNKSFQLMWEVKRYNKEGSFNNWYYCYDCFVDKDEILLEIDSDSYPYGLYPIDDVIKNKNDSWCISMTDINRRNRQSNRTSNYSRKRKLLKNGK